MQDFKRSMNHVHTQSTYVSRIFLTIDDICCALEYSPIGPSNRGTVVPVRYEINLYIKFILVIINKGLKILSILKNVYIYIYIYIYTHIRFISYLTGTTVLIYIYIYNHSMIGRISK
jgi:hypothetical protein